MTGLVAEGCVKLGEEVAADIWSAVSAGIVSGIDGAVGATGCVDGAGAAADGVCGGCEALAGVAGVTAAAAAAEYRTGRGAGRGCDCLMLLSRPAFNMLAIGFWSKFGGGGGFAAERKG